jgi:twitching motility protein PilU
MDIKPLLKLMVDRGASDLFFSAGRPPCIKLSEQLVPVGDKSLSPEQAEAAAKSIMTPDRYQEFLRTRESNFAYWAEDTGRFRVSAFFQKDSASVVIRHIESQIPTTDQLEVPSLLNELVMLKRGLILMVGATGTGKSTTQAAMVGYRNRNSASHILTIEDPIEFVHENIRSIVNQREVGIDTESFAVALKNSLRQAPDVILIGEVRDRITMEHAITFSETGHLCMGTLHANNANQALDRIINFFPEDRRPQLLLDLSLNLKAIVAQQLIPRATAESRLVPCVEILINSPYISDLIRRGEIHKIKDQMKRSREQGMVTFDQALYELYADGKIGYEDALRYADSANEVRLMIKLSTDQVEDEAADKDAASGMSLM